MTGDLFIVLGSDLLGLATFLAVWDWRATWP